MNDQKLTKKEISDTFKKIRKQESEIQKYCGSYCDKENNGSYRILP